MGENDFDYPSFDSFSVSCAAVLVFKLCFLEEGLEMVVAMGQGHINILQSLF